MKYLLFFIFLLPAIPVFSQEKTGFAIDPNANNVAALFTMTDEDGRERNLDLMQSIFADGSLGFDYERHHNVSSKFIYNKLTELSSKLESDATLLLYFNSHGGGSGNRFAMVASDSSFKFSKAIEALGKSGRKIKRLIFLVDTCHAAGSIQESLKQDGELLKNLQSATPTNYLPEISNNVRTKELPFIGIFTTKNQKLDFGQDSGVYDEILIISSSSVEDLSMRGAFASRMAITFQKVKQNEQITVGEFLKLFAESHYNSGQQPYYKILPNKSMFSEFLFGTHMSRMIPIKNWGKKSNLENLIEIP
jgi:hypothetical protein